MKTHHWISTILAAGLLAACNSTPPDTFPGQPVTQRNQLFKQMLRSFEPIGQMAKGKKPYDANEAIALAEEVKRLAPQPWNHFPPGSDYAPSKAKAAVWDKPQDFTRAKDDFLATADKLAAAARERNVDPLRAAYETMQQSCSSCHKKFRD